MTMLPKPGGPLGAESWVGMACWEWEGRMKKGRVGDGRNVGYGLLL